MKTLMATLAALALFSGVAVAKGKTSEDRTGKKEHQMANCPSAVPGATTIVANSKAGVVVTVTSDKANVTDEIRRRAHIQENVAAQTARGAIEHTGEGTGSGKFGYCPGLVQGTSVAVDDIPDGARLTVRAASPSEVQALQQSTRARLRDLSAKR
jgi:hypothetical protein